MHPSLNILEVQRAIFRYANSYPGGLATVATLARTCRAFNSTALDELWTELYSFMDLVQSLPRDLWKIGPMDKIMTFQRSISLKDWEVFFRYSSRVRTLIHVGPLARTRCLDLGDDVIFALSTPPTYGPLIPHLKKLCWDEPNRKYASLLRLLLTPSLDILSLDRYALHPPEVSILNSISTACPSLKTLSITQIGLFFNTTSIEGEKILSDVLLHLHSLESLTCPALDESTIAHLSHLPFLTALSLNLQLDFRFEKVNMAPPAFASLQSLALHATTVSTLVSFLEPMRFKPRDVSFSLAITPTPDALRLFFLALVNACDSEQLLRISLITSEEGRTIPQQISLATFQSLLVFPNIIAFEFDVAYDIALDDDAIAMLVEHWPKLTTFSINAESGWGITSRVTPQGLITLLSRCTMLVDITLEVDFSEIDGPHIPESRPGSGVTNMSCLVANFVASEIVFPATIAAFLSDICPRLTHVKSLWGPDMPGAVDPFEADRYEKKWLEVDDLLPAFHAVRRQCMKWAQRETEEGSVLPA